MIPLIFMDGLAFIPLTLIHQQQSLHLARVLVDTGSATSIFKTDDLRRLGMQFMPNDPIQLMRGIGGQEAVIEKRIDSLQIGTQLFKDVIVQSGAMSYAPDFDGIIGMDFLLASHALLDLKERQLRF
jgi:hypothetical protein